LAALISVLVVGHLWWIHRNRTTLAVDLDEAGLLVRSETWRAAVATGPSAVWRAWTVKQTSAPGLSVSTAVSTSIFGRSPVAFLLPEVAALVVLLLAVWWVSRQLGAGRWALLTVALVGVSPGVVLFTRAHHQIVPGAAALALCVAVGLRTDALRDRRWSVLLGVAVGIALLTRAMLVVSAPLAIAAWAVAWLGRRPVVREQVLNALRAAGAATLVALLWWAFAAGDVVRYLVHGAGSGGSSSASSLRLPFTEVRLSGRVLAGVEDYSFAWACVALLALGVTACVVRAVARRGPHLDLAELYVLVIAAATFAGLIASQDDFPGYFVLVVPIVMAWAVARAAREIVVVRSLVLAPVAGLVIAGVFTFLGSGAGWYQQGLWILPNQHPDAAGTSWADTYRWVVGTSADLTPEGCSVSAVVVQSEHWMTQAQVQWAGDVLRRRDAVLVASTETEVTPASVARGIGRARDAGSLLILVSPTEESSFAPLPAVEVTRAAQRQGYIPRARRLMPNGRTVSIWAPAGNQRDCS